MSEPRPVDESVPDTVLDELKRAFEDEDPPAEPSGGGSERAVEPGSLDGEGQVPADASADLPLEGSGDVLLEESGDLPGEAADDDPDVTPGGDPAPSGADLVVTRAAAETSSEECAEPKVEPEARTTIVIGGEDQLPDLRYLDELTDERERPSAIVIGNELDSSGAFDAVPLPSRSMDPRVRERRIAVKRERGRRRLIIVASIAAVVIAVVAVLAVLASSLFSVEVVDVQGAPYTTARNGEELQAVIDSLLGEPVLLVDTEAARRSLEAIPWVERAFVTTDFPDRVLIDIRERQPLATFAGSDLRWRVIDRDGRVLDVLDGQPIDYMPIEGLTPDADPGQLAGTPFALAAQLVAALPAEVRQITEAVTVDAASGDFGLRLQGPIDVRLGGFDRMDTKLARLLQQVRDGVDGITGIDLATDEIAVTSS